MATSGRGQGGRNKSQWVEGELRTRLEKGKYQVDTSLPPERKLIEELGVGRDTLRKVLRRLAAEGWIETRPGSGSRVLRAGSSSGQGGAEATPVLSAVIDEAFRQPRVTLDTLTLTSENLVHNLTHPVDLICGGNASAPREVRIRMLLPTEDEVRRPAYPRAVDPQDARVWQRWRGMARRFGKQVGGLVRDLSSAGVDAAVEVRRVPLTPTQKLYIVNGSQVLFASYVVAETDIELDDGSLVPAYDVRGDRLELSKATADSRRDQERKQFDGLVNSFESYWTFLSEPDSASD
ncbi:FadR/GntR family transcriptional regulator [Streptomyces sp. NPDC057740]|uniref:FadR/GntR family transcriptional regulator n=1 Tax=Streptomyces sp. NPDC057740 TaxID=3346234 RepID=UPI0036B594DE